MKINYFLFTLLFSSFFSFSQTQGIAYTAVGKGVATTFLTDYHCLGINSSALGWGTGFEKKRFTMGSSEFAFGMYSDSLDVDKLKNLSSAVRQSILSKSISGFNPQQQLAAAGDYAQAGISIAFDFNWGGFSFQGKKFGGIAFNVRENYQWYSKFNEQTTDLIFRGRLANYFDSITVVFGVDTSVIANNPSIDPDTLANAIRGSINLPLNLGQITQGSELKMVWNRTYNFGYGRKLFGKDSVFEVFAGIGGRFISSMAMFQMESTSDGFFMYTALSPAFNINIDPNVVGSNPLSYNGGIPPAVGNGYGIDLSGSVKLFGKLTLAASVNNIGSVTYKRNVYRVKDSLFGNFDLAGLSSADITRSMKQLVSSGGLFTLVGEQEYKLANAADFRFGASFAPFKQVQFGFDFVAPFDNENPGSIQNAVISFGGELRPVKWLSLSAGYFGGGIYKSNIPVGINFILKGGGYEFGISSRDALTFFTKKSNSISGAFGFARFRF